MNGISDDLEATVLHALRGTVSESYARSQVGRGEAWLDRLGARRQLAHYQDEVREVEAALADLRSAIRRRWPKFIRLLWVPQRVVTGAQAIAKDEIAANILASQDYRTRAGTADPGYIKARQLVRPSIEVVRLDDGWVNRTGGPWHRRRVRARVETAYELLLDGQRALIGSKRYVMRQADWAVMVDPVTGKLPAIETLTGVAKRRALYQLRRAHRPKLRLRKRSAPRRRRNADKGRHGDKRALAAARALLAPENRLLPASRWRDPLLAGVFSPAVEGILTNYVTGERKTILLGGDE